MLRTVFLAIFIVVWLIVATYVGILVLLSAFRRRQPSVPSPITVPERT
ncbi:MAG TPA: hypothetical protein VGT06_09630 [Candidatus Methylomirabilis sp.]|jgi:hypothetical protein|nr:hypothetical protein [Candidatus Methylomirabilis sp.]